MRTADNQGISLPHPVEDLCGCGCNLGDLLISSIRHNQMISLVPQMIEVTKHRHEVKVCHYDRIHLGDASVAAVPIQYGGFVHWRYSSANMNTFLLTDSRNFLMICLVCGSVQYLIGA